MFHTLKNKQMHLSLRTVALFLLVGGITACGKAPKGIEIVPDEAQRKVDILYDGKLFTSYIYPADLEKPVLYPIFTSNGTDITRGYPLAPRPFERVDHLHHVGAWFNFGDVNGIDFWGNSTDFSAERRLKCGWIRHRSIVEAQNGADKGILTVAADWVNHAGEIMLKEETKFIFSGEGDWRIIERITRLTAQHDTIVFADNKEGMIAIRMDRAFEEPSTQPELYLDANGQRTKEKVVYNEGVNGVYRNSEGFEKGDVWGKPAKWVCLSAEKDGEKISVAIIDHPNNHGYPAHSHARGYGLFSTNNMGSHAFEPDVPILDLVLNPGYSTTFRHLIVVKTNGFASDGDLNGLFADFNSSKPYQVSDAERAEGFAPLFNGADMSGWTGNLKDYFAINGTIVCDPSRGGKGNLFTDKEYANFIMRFDFLLTPGANNGIGIRAPLSSLQGGVSSLGMEIQVLDNEDEKYKNIQPYQLHGSVYGVIPAKRGFLNPPGEWNTQEIMADGNHIKVTLNGTVILDGDLAEASRNFTQTMDGKDHPGLSNKGGHIGFLGHGSYVVFRNLRIKDL